MILLIFHYKSNSIGEETAGIAYLTGLSPLVWASLVAQLVKNLPAMWEKWAWVQFLGWEDPLEKGKVTHSCILAWRIPCSTVHGGHKELDRMKRLSLSSLF